MKLTDLSKTDAENIQILLEYIQQNGIIHKELIPEALKFITPQQYKEYKRMISDITPAVVENDAYRENTGLPATEYLGEYLAKGGFLMEYKKEVAQLQQQNTQGIAQALQQQIETNQQWSASTKTAIEISKASSNKATIALILAVLALIIEILRMVID